ncbi:RecF/RecN/SMC N terminal domain containing protein [Theileria equi strain WA]|uniref:Structural maintenance of chromosomes protein n=1 Tax=Theileria equi strain WA TaxID=1537102 RepID=L0ATM4_THEEQ|nr:RecF/RecN/SMC N terminal domain containing protein [Theileria equi strain WA]AFZ78997.1 RecF/RecN/SMC N terminal domain containing protein [Theileria equi strain WA]|eukprot:XP_004828663.1 RecF/RecN/SMC N terminal domain containing protein [Theileria equi strain WA]
MTTETVSTSDDQNIAIGDLHNEINTIESGNITGTTDKIKRKKHKEHIRTIGAEIRNMNEPIRRLIIDKVVLRNFKSYGGTTTIGPFHKRFTSIVGPNGSGKSNVIDAMLFVFGFRAKQIRLGKLSELIHNSNFYVNKNNGNPLESMEVAIHFCEILDHNPDSDNYDVIEGSQLVISREVFCDNTSKYRINGTISTQKEVSNALKHFGMDLYNNRFLILQGEVEQISQMKPKATKPDEEGLLEYLEDIIGTNQYLDQIKEAQTHYEELQDQYQQFSNKAILSQKEVEDLKDANDEANRYLFNEKLFHETMFLVTQKEIYDGELEKNVLSKDISGLEEQLRDYKKEISNVFKEKEDVESQIKSQKAELNRLLYTQKKLSDHFKKLCTKDEDLRMQLLREVKKVEEKTILIKKLTSKKPQLEKESKEKLAESENLLKTIPLLQSKLDNAEAELERLSDNLKPELEKAAKDLSFCEAVLAPIQQSYDDYKKEIKALEISIELLHSSEIELTKNLSSLKKDEKELKRKIKYNEELLKTSEASLEDGETKLRVIKDEICELEKDLHDKNTILIKLRDEYESLKHDITNLSNEKDQYKFIMNLASNENLSGIHGKLGDLCSIDKKYEKAFLVACGPAIETIVVDTPEIASKIFTELRRHNLGRVSAVSLSILNRDLKRLLERKSSIDIEKLPQGTQRLIDLIKPDQLKYKVCFYHAVRDTLVVNNFDDAKFVGYQMKKRVVTIDGEIIEPDGRLSGGGVPNIGIKDRRPSFGKSVDTNAMRKMKYDIDNKIQDISNIKDKLRQLSENEHSISKDMVTEKYNINLLSQNIENDSLHLGELLENIRNSELKIEDLKGDNRINLLKKDLEKKIEECNAIKKNVESQETSVSKAYEVLQNVGCGVLKESKLNVAKLDDELSKIRGDVEKLRKTAASLLGDAEKCARDILKYEKDIGEHKIREKGLETQLDNLEDEASEVNNKLTSLNKDCDQYSHTLKELNELLTTKNAIINEHELQSVDIKHRVDDLHRKLNAVNDCLSRHKTTLLSTKQQFEDTIRSLNLSNEATSLLYKFTHDSGVNLPCSSTMDQCSDEAEACRQDSLDKMEIIDPDTAKNTECDTSKQEEIPTIDLRQTKYSNELRIASNENLETINKDAMLKRVQELKRKLSHIPNLRIVEEYKKRVEEYIQKKKDLLIIQTKRDYAKSAHEHLCFKRKSEFLLNFAIIANKLKEVYQAITLGGDAELELVDSTEPFTEGILFSVRPVKKSWKQIHNLSGGEKTLSSLALVFALHHYKPNPVYFMDEIDAALDFRNVSIIAKNIKERTKDAQFIIISLRNQMFELCNQMVGIYKTCDITKSVCINPMVYSLNKRRLKDDEIASQ